MTQEQLLASLTTLAPEGWYPDGDDDDTRYADWSTRLPDGGYLLEVGGQGDDAVRLEMTRDDMVQLHRALTITLLGSSC